MSVCTGNCDRCTGGEELRTRLKHGELLIFACSGGANVAEVADQVARGLMDEGWGSMYCLAGMAAGIPGMLQTVRNARMNVVLDGCGVDCARKLFESQGFHNLLHVRITELGIEKTRSRRAQPEEVASALQKVHLLLNKECPRQSRSS